MCLKAARQQILMKDANALITEAIAEIEECVTLGGGLYEALPEILEKLREAGLNTAVPTSPAEALQAKKAKSAEPAKRTANPETDHAARTAAADKARRQVAFERGELPLEMESLDA